MTMTARTSAALCLVMAIVIPIAGIVTVMAAQLRGAVYSIDQAQLVILASTTFLLIGMYRALAHNRSPRPLFNSNNKSKR
jgi:hypothetical protein